MTTTNLLFSLVLLSGYIGTCEFRAQTYKDCQTRWDVVIAICVPSPAQGLMTEIQSRRRKMEPSAPQQTTELLDPPHYLQ